MRPGLGTELTTRSDAVVLPAGSGLPDVRPTLLLDAEAELDTWRIVEVFSRIGPFEVDLSWSAGNGSGAAARVTVPRSTRICLFARSLRVAALNLCDATHRVGVTVGDGFAVTANVRELHGRGPGRLDVPPFSRRVRLDLADSTQLAAARLQVLDGLGAQRADVPCLHQPDSGVPLGDTGSVQVDLPPEVDWRLIFTLCL